MNIGYIISPGRLNESGKLVLRGLDGQSMPWRSINELVRAAKDHLQEYQGETRGYGILQYAVLWQDNDLPQLALYTEDELRDNVQGWTHKASPS